MYPFLLLLLFADASTAGTVPPLFVAIPDHTATVDGGLSRGVAFGDADGDGDVMYQNQAQGTWLKLSLSGSASNRMAVGARVTITTRLAGQPSRQVRWLSTTTGYASQNEPILHFGLGGVTIVENISVDWPSGRHDSFENVTANQHLHISEGET